MVMNIAFPVKNVRKSEQYGLIFEDSAGVTHYWNFDGTYDGMSSDPNTDPQSGTCLN